MKELGFILALCVIAFGSGYAIGFQRSETRHAIETVKTTQATKDAVSRAAETLSGVATTITEADKLYQTAVQEIENEAPASGVVCRVPADRLRSLDAIGR